MGGRDEANLGFSTKGLVRKTEANQDINRKRFHKWIIFIRADRVKAKEATGVCWKSRSARIRGNLSPVTTAPCSPQPALSRWLPGGCTQHWLHLMPKWLCWCNCPQNNGFSSSSSECHGSVSHWRNITYNNAGNWRWEMQFLVFLVTIEEERWCWFDNNNPTQSTPFLNSNS